jgi:hypothetical protein
MFKKVFVMYWKQRVIKKILIKNKKKKNKNKLRINNVKSYSLNTLDIERNQNSKALLIGINYNNSPNKLNGCINDIYLIRDLLLKRSFKPENIILLTDTQNNYDLEKNLLPTKQNIMNNLIQLYSSCNNGIVYYSGHGSEIKLNSPIKYDTQYNQVDCIIPSNFNPNKKNSIVTDLDIKNIINKYGNINQKISMFFDSCVNQTISNLKFGYYSTLNKNNTTIPYQITRNNVTNYTNINITKGQVFLISGSTDKGNSVDSYNQQLNQPNSAYTMSFISCFDSDPLIVYDFLTFLNLQRIWMKKHRFKQIPQLSSGRLMTPENTYINF